MHKIIILFACGTLVFEFNARSQGGQPSQDPVQRSADSLFFNQQYDAALAKYREVLAANTSAPAVVYARTAFTNHYLKNYKEAMKWYDVVLKKQIGAPMKAQLYSRMAMTYSASGEKDKAFIFLDSAIANGYFNVYEMENFKDYENLRKDTRFKTVSEKVTANAYPCLSRPEARQFDFWIGDWEVYNNLYPNHRVGTSRIENISGGCSILENWEAFQMANSGKSQNWYDPSTKKWTQLWIGSGGGAQYFTEGEYKDGAMRFKYTRPGPSGTRVTGNFIFYNLGPNKVRQYQDVTNDGGKTYQVVYDFIYIRKK